MHTFCENNQRVGTYPTHTPMSICKRYAGGIIFAISDYSGRPNSLTMACRTSGSTVEKSALS